MSPAVPRDAVIYEGNTARVWVVKDDSTVTGRQVTTGPTEGASTEVTSGLKDGERVITDGVDRIREGAKVEVVVPGQRPPRTGQQGQDGKGGRKGLFQKGDGKGKGDAQGNPNEGKGSQ